MTPEPVIPFAHLQLSAPVLEALADVGYENPTPIQTQTIPLLLEGRDVLGQAQTGTGKTAAFALPVLSNLDLSQKAPQVLVLAPTRELAIQVAEAFQTYAARIPGFQVLPVYGGQDYSGQIRALKRGVHVVVGTPGRVMDHMRRGTLTLDALKTLVLDEADEMLRMGFIDDVEWILEQTPSTRQIALFSATMPKEVRRIATAHLRNPGEITIAMKTATASLIRQRYWPVTGMQNKLDALTRILEAESFDAMLIFVRTKIATLELADKLAARGFAAAALNGDIAQKQRELTIEKLKKGKLDIVVATDVAARGLDVERISHVVNYDIPYDTEAYIHRIGRTGRAGRAGDAILFVTQREKRLLKAIEKATRQVIELMEMPSVEMLNDKRIAQFKQSITDTLANEDLALFADLIEQYRKEHDVPVLNIAAALAKQAQGSEPLLLEKKPERARPDFKKDNEDWKARRAERDADREGGRESKRPRRDRDDGEPRKRSEPRFKDSPVEEGMERYRIEVGHTHQVMPGNIVGAIANEAGLESKYIGRINIYEDYSTVDLPEGMPKEIFDHLKKTWVAGQAMRISLEGATPAHGGGAYQGERSGKPGKGMRGMKGGKGKKPRRDNASGKPGEAKPRKPRKDNP